MTKSIWAGLIALAIVLTCGILEVVALQNSYEKLADECAVVVQKAQNQTLTSSEYDEFYDKWYELRENSELLLPHNDVYELNLRFAEGKAYAREGDYEQLLAQLAVIDELLQYIPHLMVPNIKHIV